MLRGEKKLSGSKAPSGGYQMLLQFSFFRGFSSFPFLPSSPPVPRIQWRTKYTKFLLSQNFSFFNVLMHMHMLGRMMKKNKASKDGWRWGRDRVV